MLKYTWLGQWLGNEIAYQLAQADVDLPCKLLAWARREDLEDELVACEAVVGYLLLTGRMLLWRPRLLPPHCAYYASPRLSSRAFPEQIQYSVPGLRLKDFEAPTLAWVHCVVKAYFPGAAFEVFEQAGTIHIIVDEPWWRRLHDWFVRGPRWRRPLAPLLGYLRPRVAGGVRVSASYKGSNSVEIT